MNNPHWLIIAEDGVPEMYLDHTLLSSARMCESRFMLDHVQLYRGRGIPWALDFGTLIHHCMEYYYKKELAGEPSSIKEFLEFSANKWREGNYDRYKDVPQFKAIGGFPGFIATLTQYWSFYQIQTKLKPIALEVAYGKNKEVPLLTDHTLYPYAPFRLYLSGRFDYIFDDGRRLGPLDHKSFSIAGKNPFTSFEVQEGMTGYIYAMTHIYNLHYKDLLKRDTNVLWLNFILTKPEADLNKKFQRIPLYKTPSQLEEYRVRQISTAAKIYQLLFQGRPPDFNAGVCTNYFHGICPYQPIHRLGNPQDQLVILGKDFVQGHVWDPENIPEKESYDTEVVK